MKDGIIVDLDGTLCNVEHRRHFIEKRDWDSFYENLVNDTLNSWCFKLIEKFAPDYDIIFVTGRPEEYRSKTEKWLIDNTAGYDHLYMRKDKDFRKDSIIKEEIYRQHIEPHYKVLFCVDDRKQVVDMWRSIGLTCLQCAEGDF